MNITKKSQALKLFNNSASDLARAMGITRAAIWQWPENLNVRTRREIIGTLVELGLWKVTKSTKRKN